MKIVPRQADETPSAPTFQTIGHWLSGKTPVQKRNQQVVLAVFFGYPTPDYEDVAALRAAWTKDSGPADVAPPAQPAPAPLRWEPVPETCLREDFARMYIEPQATSGPDGNVKLVVTVTLSEIYLKLDPTAEVPSLSLNVRPATVEVRHREENLQPAIGSVLGRDILQDGVRYAAGWRLENPRGLNSNPLAGVTLCEMQPVRHGPYGVTLTLRCRDLDLEVEYLDPPAEVSEMKRAVLRRVLQRMHCDPDADYVELGTAGLRPEAAR